MAIRIPSESAAPNPFHQKETIQEIYNQLERREEVTLGVQSQLSNLHDVLE